MAGDINLLPNDLRDKERRLKAKQTLEPVAAEVKYSQPARLTPAMSAGPTLSFWQRWKNKLTKVSKSAVGQLGATVSQTDKPATNVKQPVAAVSRPATDTNLSPGAVKAKDKPVGWPLSAVVEVKASPAVTSQVKTDAGRVESRSTATPPTGSGFKPTANKVQPTESALEQLDVNLIPLGQRSQPTGPAKRLVLAFWLVGVLVVASGYGGLVFYRQERLNNYQRQQDDLIKLQQQLEGLRGQSEEILSVNLKLKTAARLLADKITWQPVFAFLEKNTVPTVYYTSLAADSGGKITLVGQGPNYTEVMRQMRALEQAPEVAGVDISNLQQVKAGGGLVGFSLVLTLNPQVFKASAP